MDAQVSGAGTTADGKYLALAGGTMTGPIKGLENPTENDEAANKAYVDAQVSGAGTTADGKYLALAGGTMTGPIAMGGQKITGAADPTENQDVATKAYVDGEIANVGGTYLPLAGGTMTGPVEMGNNKITGIATPTENTDAANKSYVDSALSSSPIYGTHGEEIYTPVTSGTYLSNYNFTIPENGNYIAIAGIGFGGYTEGILEIRNKNQNKSLITLNRADADGTNIAFYTTFTANSGDEIGIIANTNFDGSSLLSIRITIIKLGSLSISNS